MLLGSCITADCYLVTLHEVLCNVLSFERMITKENNGKGPVRQIRELKIFGRLELDNRRNYLLLNVVV